MPRANKVLLLGEQKTQETDKWKQVIDSDGVYEYGFVLLNRKGFALDGDQPYQRFPESSKETFEGWLVRRYGVPGAGWMALDMDGRLIASGTKTPSAKEFKGILERRGLQSPLKLLRAFLRENPDHLEARADILKEVRRRALARMPADAAADLDAEKDLLVWGATATETDAAFRSQWIGLELGFFRPDKKQPERFSKLMKAVFRRHISSVESALRVQPTDRYLWNIWAWMARGPADYNWGKFIDSLGTFAYHDMELLCPSAEVCVWLIAGSMAKKDWQGVVRFAKIAGYFQGYHESDPNDQPEWLPGRNGWGRSMNLLRIEGGPAKTIHLPHIEALLRLGMGDDANDVFDEMMRYYGGAANAAAAAQIAKAVGMENVAELWGRGEIISKVPYSELCITYAPSWILFTDNERDGKFHLDFLALLDRLPACATSIMEANRNYEEGLDKLGWKAEDAPKWGLIASDGRLVEEDSEIPADDHMQDIIKKHGMQDPVEVLRRHIEEHGDQTEMRLHFIRWRFWQIVGSMTNNRSNTKDERDWSEVAKHFGLVLADCPSALLHFDYVFSGGGENLDIVRQSQSMKSLSQQCLAVLESLLERVPSQTCLWNEWLFWRDVADDGRPLGPLLECLKPSPLALERTLPPSSVAEACYKECRKNRDWPKLIDLLKNAWDREIHWFANKDEFGDEYKWRLEYELGDRVGFPLIASYLCDGRPQEASEVFNQWLDCGGTFASTAMLIEFAESMGETRLAAEWDRRSRALGAEPKPSTAAPAQM